MSLPPSHKDPADGDDTFVDGAHFHPTHHSSDSACSDDDEARHVGAAPNKSSSISLGALGLRTLSITINGGNTDPIQRLLCLAMHVAATRPAPPQKEQSEEVRQQPLLLPLVESVATLSAESEVMIAALAANAEARAAYNELLLSGSSKPEAEKKALREVVCSAVAKALSAEFDETVGPLLDALMKKHTPSPAQQRQAPPVRLTDVGSALIDVQQRYSKAALVPLAVVTNDNGTSAASSALPIPSASRHARDSDAAPSENSAPVTALRDAIAAAAVDAFRGRLRHHGTGPLFERAMSEVCNGILLTEAERRRPGSIASMLRTDDGRIPPQTRLKQALECARCHSRDRDDVLRQLRAGLEQRILRGAIDVSLEKTFARMIRELFENRPPYHSANSCPFEKLIKVAERWPQELEANQRRVKDREKRLSHDLIDRCDVVFVPDGFLSFAREPMAPPPKSLLAVAEAFAKHTQPANRRVEWWRLLSLEFVVHFSSGFRHFVCPSGQQGLVLLHLCESSEPQAVAEIAAATGLAANVVRDTIPSISNPKFPLVVVAEGQADKCRSAPAAKSRLRPTVAGIKAAEERFIIDRQFRHKLRKIRLPAPRFSPPSKAADAEPATNAPPATDSTAEGATALKTDIKAARMIGVWVLNTQCAICQTDLEGLCPDCEASRAIGCSRDGGCGLIEGACGDFFHRHCWAKTNVNRKNDWEACVLCGAAWEIKCFHDRN